MPDGSESFFMNIRIEKNAYRMLLQRAQHNLCMVLQEAGYVSPGIAKLLF